MTSRSKQTISLELLKELCKRHLTTEPNPALYLHEDVNVVVKSHVHFFSHVAEHTARLNPVALCLMVRDVWQLKPREAQLFGESMARAFSHCMCAGSKATSGVKLLREVTEVYTAAQQAGVKKEAKSSSSVVVKTEAPCKRPPEANSPQQPARKVIKCLSSPSQIAAMYAIPSNVKVMQCVHIHIYIYINVAHTNTQEAHTHIYIYICI